MNDSHGCIGALNGAAVITVNNPPVLTRVGTNLSCNADHTGSIDLTVTAGVLPLSFMWTGPMDILRG